MMARRAPSLQFHKTKPTILFPKRFIETGSQNFRLPNIIEEDYPPKVIEIVKELATFSVFESIEMAECASIRLNLPNPYFESTSGLNNYGNQMRSGAPPPQGGAQTEGKAEVQEEKKEEVNVTYNVKLKAVEGGVKGKFAIMKLIGTVYPDLSLAQKKELVDKLPSTIGKALAPDLANDLVAKLKEAGGDVEMEAA